MAGVAEGTDLKCIGRSRRQTGNRRGRTCFTDGLVRPRTRDAAGSDRRPPQFIGERAQNGCNGHQKETFDFALVNLADELRQRLSGRPYMAMDNNVRLGDRDTSKRFSRR